MIIKKFQGKTENDAIESAKKELGAGIVVMNVKEVKRKGLFAFLKSKLIEVTVALEEEPDRVLPEKKKVQPAAAGQTDSITGVNATEVPKNTAKVQPVETGKNDKVLEQKLDSLQSLIEKQLQRDEAKEEPKTEKAPASHDKPEEEENGNGRF